LFGRLLAARSFKRWSGVLMLVVELPDGSPGSIRADATDVERSRRVLELRSGTSSWWG